MKLTVVYPTLAHSAYKIAADAFASLAEQVSGIKPSLRSDEDLPASDEEVLVLIGNDAVNSCTAKLYLSQAVEPFRIRYGTDDYCIRTLVSEGRSVLILAGGRPRATLYAVYRYFEKFCGCRWFWDGDRIPHGNLPVAEIDLTESPRFEYRGLRYFAHRSLHRFQAEHWSLEEWKTEIDWILKKRLNLFMLRIGMDDLFQRAFPDTVSYPELDKPLPEAGEGYDDRTLFWSLEYRGELRKQLLKYAFERDLMHPEDCGTMTHWYSRTPLELLEKEKLELLPQSNSTHNDPTGRVWEVRDKKNFERYLKLTDTHVREFGTPEIFHTIGLGERKFSKDPEENKRMKLFVYHAIATQIKERYPNAPLLLASWDFWLCFTPEEVKSLVAEMDPSQAIIFDYTSDTVHSNNFTKWGIVNKFPWIFGIFGGYEPNSDVRGNYELANERIRLAKQDPFCKGMVLWPELSHADPFTLDFVIRNAWEEETLSLSEQTRLFCRERYPEDLADSMTALWQDFLPIAQMVSWSIDDNTHAHTGDDTFAYCTQMAGFKKENAELYRSKVEKHAKYKDLSVSVLKALAKIPTDDPMTRRDLYDIARTVIGRYLNGAIFQGEVLFTQSRPVAELKALSETATALMEALVRLLGSNEEYSLLDSLRKLEAVTETNPNFEHTLKNNAENYYCRSYIYENAAYLYLPELELTFDHAIKAAIDGTAFDREAVQNEAEKIRARYFQTPLAEMDRISGDFAETVTRAADLIGRLEF